MRIHLHAECNGVTGAAPGSLQSIEDYSRQPVAEFRCCWAAKVSIQRQEDICSEPIGLVKNEKLMDCAIIAEGRQNMTFDPLLQSSQLGHFARGSLEVLFCRNAWPLIFHALYFNRSMISSKLQTWSEIPASIADFPIVLRRIPFFVKDGAAQDDENIS
jgi:hypothetical protein